MAAVTPRSHYNNTANLSSYVSPAFTPSVGDLIVVFAGFPDAVTSATIASSASGLTFTRVSTITTGALSSWMWVADSLVTSGQDVSQTITITLDAGNRGGFVQPFTVAGMTKTGTAAVKQILHQKGSSGTVSFTMPAAWSTANPGIGGWTINSSSTNPDTIPSAWTQAVTDSYASPTTRNTTWYLDSGLTLQAFDVTVSQSYSAVFLELDASGDDPGPPVDPLAIIDPVASAVVPFAIDITGTAGSETTRMRYLIADETASDPDGDVTPTGMATVTAGEPIDLRVAAEAGWRKVWVKGGKVVS